MHRATPQFWRHLAELPEPAQRTARRNFLLLAENPGHPSLRFKKVGKFWSARVGRDHRALAIRDGDDLIWVWVGSHDDYDRRIDS
ncbi:MAG: hypothetical protein F4236_09810 [Acidimicrobiia bacterium]|nr:hypothetical protein [Acidimicrobiia bacterium]MYB25849.1 hypothetical protein [Acidimicrobiia bacterium]MYE68390.1 hypothetical protein [Acidimicrobiia bacterium]